MLSTVIALTAVMLCGCNSRDNSDAPRKTGDAASGVPDGELTDTALLDSSTTAEETGADAGVTYIDSTPSETVSADTGGAEASGDDRVIVHPTFDSGGSLGTMIGEKPAPTWASSIGRFTFFSSIAGASYECRLDGESWSDCTSPYSVALTNGPHRFEVRAVDALGTADPNPARYDFVVDAPVAKAQVLSGPRALSNDPSPILSFDADMNADGGLGFSFQCNLDGGTWAACASPFVLSSIADGVHTFSVRTKDVVGNTETDPASYTWTTDTTPPHVVVESAPSLVAAEASVSVRFASPDGAVVFFCALDEGASALCSSPAIFHDLVLGHHRLQLVAVDLAGNRSETTTFDFEVVPEPDAGANIGADGPVASDAAWPDEPEASFSEDAEPPDSPLDNPPDAEGEEGSASSEAASGAEEEAGATGTADAGTGPSDEDAGP